MYVLVFVSLYNSLCGSLSHFFSPVYGVFVVAAHVLARKVLKLFGLIIMHDNVTLLSICALSHLDYYGWTRACFRRRLRVLCACLSIWCSVSILYVNLCQCVGLGRSLFVYLSHCRCAHCFCRVVEPTAVNSSNHIYFLVCICLICLCPRCRLSSACSPSSFFVICCFRVVNLIFIICFFIW